MATPNSTANLYLNPAQVYLAPTGTTISNTGQASSKDDLPSLVTAGFVNMGWLKKGVTISLNKNVYDLTPDQFAVPLLVQITGVTYTVKADIDEIILSNLPVIYGGLSSASAQTAGGGGSLSPAADIWDIGADVRIISEAMLMVNGVDHNGFFVRFFMWRAVSVVSLTMAMQKGAEMSIPIEFRGLADASRAGLELGLMKRQTAAMP